MLKDDDEVGSREHCGSVRFVDRFVDNASAKVIRRLHNHQTRHKRARISNCGLHDGGVFHWQDNVSYASPNYAIQIFVWRVGVFSFGKCHTKRGAHGIPGHIYRWRAMKCVLPVS